MQATEKIWMNGELVDWDDARIHVGAHGLHYGTGVFEGIRCYDTPKGPAVFRLTDHMQRLHDSARLIDMELPYSVDELRAATQRAARRERPPRVLHPPDRVLRLRPARRLGARQPGRDGDHGVAVGHLPRRGGARRPGSARRSRAGSASRANVVPHASKATGVYLNSMLAVTEAQRAGYDEAIMLTPEGTVADGPGETIFVVKRRQDLHARPLDRDPARDHARLGHPDRARPRLRGAGEDADPLRPLPRRRGVHVRHRRRGDAGAVGRRPGDRRRPDHAARSRRRTSTRCAAPSDRWSQWRELVPSMTRAPREHGDTAHRALRALDRRARRGARARGAALGPALARADRAAVRGAARRRRRRAVLRRGLVGDRGAASLHAARRRRARATR